MAENFHITIRRGTDVTLEVEVTEADGSPANLTGSTLYYRVARRVYQAPALSVADSAMTVSGAVVEIPLTAAQTATLGAGDHYHELYEFRGGLREVLASGRLRVVDSQVARH